MNSLLKCDTVSDERVTAEVSLAIVEMCKEGLYVVLAVVVAAVPVAAVVVPVVVVAAGV
jgi:hypothetical protein